MIGKPGLRCFHQAKFTLKGLDHQLSSSEVIQFHHANQSVLEKLFELPFDMGSVDIVVKELSMATQFKELA